MMIYQFNECIAIGPTSKMHAAQQSIKRRRSVSHTENNAMWIARHEDSPASLRRDARTQVREPNPALAAASAPLRSATSLAAMSQCCPASATVAVTSAPTFASAAVAASESRGISARKARRGPHRHLVTVVTLGKASRAGLSQTDEPSPLYTSVHRHRRPRPSAAAAPPPGCWCHTKDVCVPRPCNGCRRLAA